MMTRTPTPRPRYIRQTPSAGYMVIEDHQREKQALPRHSVASVVFHNAVAQSSYHSSEQGDSLKWIGLESSAHPKLIMIDLGAVSGLDQSMLICRSESGAPEPVH